MQIIGVVGLPASGKGEFSNIAKKLNIPVVVMGDVIRKAVVDAGLALNDKNMGEMSRCLRQGMGMDALAQLTIPLIEQNNSKIVLVDGIRGDAEVTTFTKHFKNFSLIAVESSFETRLKRISDRNRSDDQADENALHKRDEREAGWGLLTAMEMLIILLKMKEQLKNSKKKQKNCLRK